MCAHFPIADWRGGWWHEALLFFTPQNSSPKTRFDRHSCLQRPRKSTGRRWNFAVRKFLFLAAILTHALVVADVLPDGVSDEARSSVVSAPNENGEFQRVDFINSVVGWDRFFEAGFLGSGRVIGNIEAGLAWGGHEVFARPDGFAPAIARNFSGSGVSGEIDFHATMVTHVLAGTGYIAGSEPASFYFTGLGMAPFASVWSGAIATSYSASSTGAFTTTDDSVISVYREFAEGIGGQRPDVINSSWGGGDPAAATNTSISLDGLAAQNPMVMFVSSAGNSGSGQVSAPGSMFNGLTVGSSGGTTFLDPSDFSSHGLVDFFNPVTNVLSERVRVAVDLVAPGENLFLAAYLGQTGGLGASSDPGIATILEPDPPTDLYFLNQSGTSFPAPIVSGAIALLRDVAANDPFVNLNAVPTATDSRVIKSALMASSTSTTGWNNAQIVQNIGESLVTTTTQSLDLRTGAGALNLSNALDVYILSGTRDVDGLSGGSISSSGWDFGSVSLGSFNQYQFENPFETEIELSISLNWFAGREVDAFADTGTNQFFSDLNLEVWKLTNGEFSQLIGQSISTYNNTEFLRLNLGSGSYGVRVLLSDIVFNTTDEVISGQDYGLAWQATSVPEFGSFIWIIAVVALLARGMIKGFVPRKS